MKELPKQYDNTATEKKWQDHWLESKVYKWEADQPRANTYVIDTPPPTVSGTLHMGHIFSYTQADFVARFRRMLGQTVFYPIGFDDNGLPTERLVEKQKKVRATDMSREAFIELCMGVSKEARAEFKSLFQSVGLSFDWDEEYHTISEHARRISQMSFLDLFHKGEAYRKLQPMLWDPVDQTAIAQAEVEEKEKASHFNDITFQVEGGGSFVIGTTRPEMLPACVAIFYHPDDERYKHLQGKQAIVPLFGQKVPILEDDAVELEKGTGIMMCCTFGDEADIVKWKKHDLPLKIILNKYGKLEGIEGEHANLNGQKAEKAREAILELLKTSGELVKQEPITHAVKCAERSGAALEIIPTPQWFVKVLDHKDALQARSKECTWYPDWMQKRMEQWIDGLSWDWCISRQRYFGVPFPVWYRGATDDEPAKIIVASPDELPVNPLVTPPQGYTLHDVQDGIMYVIEDATSQAYTLTPDLDVMDTWATSSLTPQISAGAITSLSRVRERAGVRAAQGTDAAFIKWQIPQELVERARNLRKDSTDAEKKLWSLLRDRQLCGHKFRRQHPIEHYVADFACVKAGLIVELDGGQHAEDAAKDTQRSAVLESHGFKVIRFWNHEVNENLEGVLGEILKVLQSGSPHPGPLPHAGEEEERFSKLYPADLRPQAHEIIRTWAFYTLVKSHLHADTAPWKDLMISGWCLASDKTKMSKSKGNIVDPVNLLASQGADAVRYWASTSKLGTDTAYSEETIKIGRKLVTKLWNASKFASMHLGKMEGTPTTPKQDVAKDIITETLDQWILSRLSQCIKNATEFFMVYEYSVARMAIEDFFWNDFCDNYLELVKARAYGEKWQGRGQQSALYTLHHCLNAILKLFAPFVPHITEELYTHIFDAEAEREGSLHRRGAWPKQDVQFYDAQAEKQGIAAVQILGAIRKLKAEKGVSIRMPLSLVAVQGEALPQGGLLDDVMETGSVQALVFETKDLPEKAVSDNGAYTLTAQFAPKEDAA